MKDRIKKPCKPYIVTREQLGCKTNVDISFVANCGKDPRTCSSYCPNGDTCVGNGLVGKNGATAICGQTALLNSQSEVGDL